MKHNVTMLSDNYIKDNEMLAKYDMLSDVIATIHKQPTVN